MNDVEIRTADAAAAGSRALVEAMEAEVGELYADRPGTIHVVSAAAADMRPPGGGFVLVFDGRASGCGGFKRLDAAACEIKRMYLLPEVRGRGLSKLLLETLETGGRELGYRKVRLDTGDRQPASKHLYEQAGYREIPDYNANPYASFWFEKDL